MSWSINVMGEGAAVQKAVREALEGCKCAGPEEMVKYRVNQIVEEVCMAAPGAGITVVTTGSQYDPGQGRPRQWQMKLEISTVHFAK